MLAHQKFVVNLKRNWVGTSNVPRLLLILANPFQNGSVFTCSAAESGAAVGRKGEYRIVP